MTPVKRRLLFICTGNTCRSPMARFLAERLAREAGLPWSAASAGIAAVEGSSMTDGARRALAARGITGVTHVSRALTAEDVKGADAIYAMTSAHRDAVVKRFPQGASKIAVLRQAAGLPDIDVEDPIGSEDDEYARCAASIEEALKILVSRSSHAKHPL